MNRAGPAPIPRARADELAERFLELALRHRVVLTSGAHPMDDYTTACSTIYFDAAARFLAPTNRLAFMTLSARFTSLLAYRSERTPTAILGLVGDLRSPADITTATATQRTRRHLRSAVRWSASASSERTGRLALISRGLLHAHAVCAAQWGNPGSDEPGPRAEEIITAITDGVADPATLPRYIRTPTAAWPIPASGSCSGTEHYPPGHGGHLLRRTHAGHE